jgi:cytochrome c peroxidase
MKFRHGLLWGIAGLGALGAAAWLLGGLPGDGIASGFTPPTRAELPSLPPRREALSPLPPVPTLSPEKVALGRRLFVDTRLSKDDTVACATCHDLSRGGADGLPVSVGVAGQRGIMNSPTVFNAALNLAQFWDGRADTLEAQVAGPIHNPAEMASNWPEVVGKLSRDAGIVAAFDHLYPGRGLGADSIADAIGTYERSLLTPNSRFDKYLRGDKTVLSAAEMEGYRRFVDYGCVACHQGANMGGNMYQRFGAVGTRPAGRTTTAADLGRFNVTHRDQDRYVFKVPGLRNVAVTAPYFHDGRVASLDEAVALMGRAQLGRELSPEDIRLIVAFLGTLTGEWDGRPLQ